MLTPQAPQAKPENTPELLPIPTKKEPKLQQKTLDAMRLVDAGLTPKQALQATNLKKDISAAGLAVFKRKYKKHSLTEPGTVKLASRQIQRILRAAGREEEHRKVTSLGQVVDYTDNIYPTDSNIIAAASMVYDRYEPVKGQEPAGTTINYLDLSTIHNTLSGGDAQVIEVVGNTVGHGTGDSGRHV